MRNSWLLVASTLVVLVALAHSYLGERYILTRLFRRADLPHLFGSDVFTKRTLRFAWHLTSIAWVGAAVLLWVLARGDAIGGIRVVSATFFVTALVTALVTAAGSRGRHLAWPVFLAIALAAWP
ncbi:MAG: hypothetical protein P3B98_04135 [Gemmatimonadota bacterium]|nr:hypothetical protein [Gemmatimonadota bacterium]